MSFINKAKKTIVATLSITFLLLFGFSQLNLKIAAVNLQSNAVINNEPTIKQVEAGENVSFFIDSNNTLWGWGSNQYGQLGTGSTLNSRVPVRIMNDVVSVSSGERHTLAVKSDGSLWAWGNNAYNQLGDNTPTNRLSPIKIMDQVVSVSAGDYHSMAIKTDGSLWAWGRNNIGQLGDGTLTTRATPIRILENVKKIAADDGSLAILNDNSLWAWGAGLAHSSPVKIMDNVDLVSTNQHSNYALDLDGNLWSWGGYGYGSVFGLVFSEQPTKLFDNVLFVTSSDWVSAVIMSDGSLWVNGDNSAWQLGVSDVSFSSTYIKAVDSVQSVSVGNMHILAIKSDGEFWAWGTNSSGELGDGSLTNKKLPAEINFGLSAQLTTYGSSNKVVFISTGRDFSFSIDKSGSLWAWGHNDKGQLGDGTVINRSRPVKIMDDVIQVTAGYSHTLAIKSDGSLWAWGSNNFGQLGDGTTVNRITPVKILDSVLSVSSGEGSNHSFAILKDGSLWGWGYNGVGQLGDGSINNRWIPTKIMDNVIRVDAGDSHSMAMMNDGSVWAWGANQYGQLGDGTITQRLTPIKIMDNATEIACGGEQSFAIINDGSLWSWGNNSNGQLGNTTYVSTRTPFKIMDNMTNVSAEYSSSYAVKNDGTLWAWGSITSYQPGGWATKDILSPTLQTSIENVTSVSVGATHTLVLKSDGSLWAFGWDTYGQLGDGGSYMVLVPTPVLSDRIYYDLINRDVVYYPMFEGAPKINLTYSSDLDAKISIVYQDVEGNFSLSGSNEITGSQIGIATLNVTNADGSVIYKTVDVISYSTKPNISSLFPVNQFINYSVNLIFKDVSYATLNGQPFPGGLVGDDGTYRLTTYDLSGFEYSSSFSIDSVAPIITISPYDSSPTNQNITVFATTNEGILNEAYYTFTANGSFTFTVTDKAGNQSNQEVTINNIDKTPPVIFGISPGSFYNTSRTITFSEGTVTLDNEIIVSGTEVTSEGSHTVIATDSVGNDTSITFVLDFTPPSITLSNYNQLPTNQNVLVTASASGGTLNAPSHLFIENGSFDFVATDLAGNVTTRTVTITNIDKVPPVIIGVMNNGYYNVNRTISFTEGTVTLNGTSITSGTIVSAQGTYSLMAVDSVGNSTTITFTIDKTAPMVSGVANNSQYNTDRIISFDEGSATLNGEVFDSGSTVSAEGTYLLVVTDLAGNTTSMTFKLDKTLPIITVKPYTLTPTNQNITVSVTTNEGTLNASSHLFAENGTFTFIATDGAGNISEVVVTITNIDKQKPIISGVVNGGLYNHSVIVNFDEGTATYNTFYTFESGTEFTSDGVYHITVKDAAGNTASLSFEIDTLPPTVSAIQDGGSYKSDVTIFFYGGTATLDGTPIAYGTKVTEEREYVLDLIDNAGNTRRITFSIDKTKPVISGVTDGAYYNQPVTILFDDGSGVYNWTHSFVSGTQFSIEGNYYVTVTDQAGNAAYVSFVLDYTAPKLSGINDGDSFNHDQYLFFNNATGTLNGMPLSYGTVVSSEGEYVVELIDAAGNKSRTSFSIDKTAPIVSGVTATRYLYTTPAITFNEGTATLDYGAFTKGSSVATNGEHVLTVTDAAGNSTTITFKVIVTLDVPSWLGGKALTYNTIDFSWNNFGEADGYEVFRSSTSTGTFTKIGESNTRSFRYTADIFNVNYFYKIRAFVNIDGTILYSEFTSSTAVRTSLNTVSGVLAKFSSYNTNSLSWDNVPGATGYEIYRSTGTSISFVLLKTVTGVSTTDTSLITNTAYNYKIRAYRLVGTTKVYGNYSPVVSASPLPTSPIISVLSSGYNSIKISWPVVAGANGYEVSYSTSETGTYTKLALMTTNSAAISSLITNQTYYVKVRAYRIVNYVKIYGTYSSIVSIAPIPSTPVLNAVSLGYDSLKVSWGAISGATGYELYKLNPSTSSYELILDTVLLAYTDFGLETGASTSYKVKAYRLVSETKVYSLDSSIITSKALPSIITDLKILNPRYTELSLSWTSVSGATGYEISRSTTLAGTYVVIANIEGETTFTNTGLTFNTTYYYKVKAYTTVNDVKIYGSAAVAISGKTTLEAVSGQTASYTSYNTNLLKWVAVNGATGYEIYRSTGTSTTYALLTSTTTLTYTNTALATNTKYNYKIRAYRLVGTVKVYGPFSSVVSSTPLPWAPSAAVVSSGYNALKVTWPVVAGANGYEVSYSTSETGTYSKLALVTTNSASITNLLTNATYYVKARAYRIVNYVKIYGASSTIVSGTPIPSVPVITLTSVGYDSVKISWPAILGASGYELSWLNPNTSNFELISDTASLTFTHSGLVTGQLQSYTIKAYRLVGGIKVYSLDSITKTVTPVPSMVSGLKLAMPSVTSLRLTWDPIPGASGYEIFKSTSTTGSYVSLGVVESFTEYTVTGLVFNTTTYYKVRAYTTVNGVRVYGAYSGILPAKTAPSQVVLSVVNGSYNSNTLSWPVIEGANGYEIYASTGTSTYYTLLKTLTTNTFAHTGLVFNTQYNYKVRAYKVVGTTKIYGAYSLLSSVKTLVSKPMPTTSYTFDSITLNWSSVLGANGYEVSMSTSLTGVYTPIIQTSLSKTYSGLTLGNTYYFKVRAYRLVSTTKVYGAYSDVIAVTPQLAIPTMTIGIITEVSANISWASVDGASSYEVEIKGSAPDDEWIVYPTSALSLEVIGLDPGSTYTVKVRAVKEVGENDLFSEYSAIQDFTTSSTN